MAISEYLEYLRVPLDKINMNPTAHHKNSFVGRSFTTLSKTNILRIFTGITAHQFLFTGVSKHAHVVREEGIVMRIDLDDESNISIGMPLANLGLPVKGIITSIMLLPSPLEQDVVRIMINYFSPIK